MRPLIFAIVLALAVPALAQSPESPPRWTISRATVLHRRAGLAIRCPDSRSRLAEPLVCRKLVCRCPFTGCSRHTLIKAGTGEVIGLACSQSGRAWSISCRNT